jgi:hypothetical protein
MNQLLSHLTRATRTNMQVTEGFYKRINQIRRELLSISREAQVVLDKTGIHLIAEGKTVNLAEPAISTRIMREDDSLLPYVMDAVTAAEEEYDLTEAVPGHDATGLLSIATNPNNSSGQRMNAYRKLGEYIYDAQQELTATALKQELGEYSQRNGARTHTIALRARSFSLEVGILYPKRFQHITPHWVYRLPKQEYERFLQSCRELNLHVTENIYEELVGSQGLPLEGGNICGDTETFVTTEGGGQRW